ncbi:MAG: EAL domain-containing protein [Rhodocyclales bacterium]|nr:EAL domain-containing protein [Rhodocyclales bacterium]
MPDDTPQLLRQVLIGRQPILDLKQELIGYELLFRSADLPAETPACQLNATANVVCAAFAELGLGDALGPHRAFINADERFILDDVLELLPARSVVLELDFTAEPDAALLARCRTLRERGYTLALSRYAGLDARASALLPLVGIVKIDVLANADRFAELAGGLARLPLQILAEKVETREQMERCRAAGFHLFQGYYFARPTIISGRHLSASQLGIIRLLNLVAREADSADLEQNFKREPGLTVNLLRLVNAVGIGLARKVDSLRHAITVLGRKQLLRWLQLLLMAAPGSGDAPERNPLLQLAALRGRLLEILADRCAPGNRALGDEAFLTGIMSLMPAALGLPMDEILEQIPVVDDVHRALAAHEGQLGQLLALVERLDDSDWAGCDALLAELPALSREALSGSLTEALAWIHGDAD